MLKLITAQKENRLKSYQAVLSVFFEEYRPEYSAGQACSRSFLVISSKMMGCQSFGRWDTGA